MKAWILYGEKEAVKNEAYINMYFEEGNKQNVEFTLLIVEQLEIGCDESGCYMKHKGVKLDKPDFAVVRVIYPLLSSHLEEMEIKIYNNSSVALICNDKARTYQFLSARGIRCIDTIFMKYSQMKQSHPYTDEDVIKTVAGHGGAQVFLGNQKEEILSCEGAPDYVIQPRIHGTGEDIRVYVIGTEIIAAVCRHTKEGFRANYSLGGEVRRYHLNAEETNLVNQIISYFDFGMVGIDFLIDEDGHFIFNEIEDVVGARMLYQCSDINLVGRYISYMVSNK